MTTRASATNPSSSKGISGVAAIDHWASVVDRGTACELPAIAGGSDLIVLWTWGTAIFPSLLGINKAALLAAFPLSVFCLFGARLQARDSFCLLYANLPAWDSFCLLGDGAFFALMSSACDCLFGDGARVRRGFGARPLIALVLFAMCAVGESASREHHDDIPLAVGVVRSTLFDGLPPEFATPLDQVLDNRLAPSSMRKVRRAAKVWCVFAAEQGWPGLLRSDDPQRGAKLAAFVLMLVMTTKLVYSSISKYLWGLATWCVLQRQADPRIGVEGFKSFMNSVKVCTPACAFTCGREGPAGIARAGARKSAGRQQRREARESKDARGEMRKR